MKLYRIIDTRVKSLLEEIPEFEGKNSRESVQKYLNSIGDKKKFKQLKHEQVPYLIQARPILKEKDVVWRNGRSVNFKFL